MLSYEVRTQRGIKLGQVRLHKAAVSDCAAYNEGKSESDRHQPNPHYARVVAVCGDPISFSLGERARMQR